MKDKQIIIDGIDVSKCNMFRDDVFTDKQLNNVCSIGLWQRDYSGLEEFCKMSCDCKSNPNCHFKQLARAKEENEELRNKLNSNIERMNEQNEKLHNENKELKSYIKEDLVPHTQIYIGLINRIKQQMKTILMVKTNGKYRPVKNSTKEQCYQILGNIQELLKTNIMTISIKE